MNLYISIAIRNLLIGLVATGVPVCKLKQVATGVLVYKFYVAVIQKR